jgi:hypothetical protein
MVQRKGMKPFTIQRSCLTGVQRKLLYLLELLLIWSRCWRYNTLVTGTFCVELFCGTRYQQVHFRIF